MCYNLNYCKVSCHCSPLPHNTFREGKKSKNKYSPPEYLHQPNCCPETQQNTEHKRLLTSALFQKQKDGEMKHTDISWFHHSDLYIMHSAGQRSIIILFHVINTVNAIHKCSSNIPFNYVLPDCDPYSSRRKNNFPLGREETFLLQSIQLIINKNSSTELISRSILTRKVNKYYK